VKPTRIFSSGELQRLLETARLRAPRFYPLILFLADTGCRLGEALALRWSDLDLEARMARIARSFSSGERLGPTKTGRERMVNAALSNARRAHAERVSSPGREADLPQHDGWLPVRQIFNRVVSEAIGDRFHHTPHDLRHTWASLHMARGTPLKWIQEQGGWTTAKLLLETYGHFMPTESRGFSDAIAALDGAQTALGLRAAAGVRQTNAESVVISGGSDEVSVGDGAQVPNHTLD
jgi:integrase